MGLHMEQKLTVQVGEEAKNIRLYDYIKSESDLKKILWL